MAKNETHQLIAYVTLDDLFLEKFYVLQLTNRYLNWQNVSQMSDNRCFHQNSLEIFDSIL